MTPKRQKRLLVKSTMKRALLVIAALVLGLFSKVIYERMQDDRESKSELIEFLDKSLEDSSMSHNELEGLTRLLDLSAAHDEILVKGDMVNDDYRYINLPRVEAYFKAITADAEKRLPIELDDGSEMTSIEFSPYMHTYSYTIALDEEERERFPSWADSDDVIRKYCDALYYSKYQMANDVQVNLLFYDLTPKLIEPIFLDRQTCLDVAQ